MVWIFNITSFFFFVALVSDIIFWSKTWEARDYNLKRFFLFLKETKKGRRLLLGLMPVLKWFVILIYFITIFWIGSDGYYHILVFLVYTILFALVLKSIFERDFSLPGFNFRNAVSIGLTFSIGIFLFFFAPLDRFLWILIIQKIIPLLFSFCLFFVSILFDFTEDIIINRAAEKIENHRNLLSIVTVGSYGRGSTNEFISRILSAKYNVLSTKMSFSTTLGVARTILSELTHQKQIFIAEVDDYKKEDVMQMCALIKPKIVVLTGINEQKLSLFGSVEKIIDSKRGAVNSLSGDGVGIFNGNSKDSIPLIESTKKKKFIYKTGAGKADIKAVNIKESKFSLDFDVVILRKKYSVRRLKLVGAQNIENILPAIFTGIYTGIDWVQIKKILAGFRPLRGTMMPRIVAGGGVLIDDTYNANINSVQKAVSYMSLYKGKKILVLEPLFELGKNAAQTHRKLGYDIAKVADYLLLTNSNYLEHIKKGAIRAKSGCVIAVLAPSKIIKLTKSLRRDDVAVFEGQEAALALSGIKSVSPFER